MTITSKPNGHSAQSEGQAYGGSELPVLTYDDPEVRQAVLGAVKAIVRCMDNESLTEDQGYRLIRGLFAKHHIDPVSQRIEEYLEAGLTAPFERESAAVGGR